MLRRLLGKSLIYFGLLVGGKLLSAVYFMIIARAVLPEKFGQIMLFVTLIQLVTTIGDLGVKNWYLKQTALAKTPGLLGRLTAWRGLLLVCSAVIFMVAEQHFGWLQAGVWPFFLGSLAIEALVTVADAYYLSHERSFMLGVKLIVRNVLLFGSLFFIRTPDDSGKFYLAYLLTWLIMIPWYFPVTVCWRSLKHYKQSGRINWWSSWPYAAIDSLGVIYSRADQLIINRFLASSSLGIYSAAYRYLDAFNLLPQALFHNLFPLAAKKGGLSRLQIAKMVAVMCGLGFVVAGGMALGANFLTTGLLGEAYAPAAKILRLFGVVVILFFFNAPLNTVLQSSDGVARYVPFLLGSTVFNLCLNYLLVPRLGISGGVWAMVGGEGLLVLMNVCLVAQMTKSKNSPVSGSTKAVISDIIN